MKEIKMTLPYSIVIPLNDRKGCQHVGMIIADIDCFKPNNTDPTKSIVYMKNKTYHFADISVEQISEKINQICDGVDSAF
jgi:hypothetical protein